MVDEIVQGTFRQTNLGNESPEYPRGSTGWLNGVAHHIAQNVDFAVVAAADPATLRAHARDRGWNRLRLLSPGESTFKYDLGSEDQKGNQDCTISVFTQVGLGAVHHVYSAHPRMSPEVKQRGIDLITPIWHVLDRTPQGRGDWYAKLEYPMRSGD
jgi:predicted dithiol-disulfide oxidoreductase (DUF899 family)